MAADYGSAVADRVRRDPDASLRPDLAQLPRERGASGPRADLHLGVAAALLAYTLAAFFEDNWADTEVQKIALFVIALPLLPASVRAQPCDQTGDSWPNSPSS
jgi:hypothetical protein